MGDTVTALMEKMIANRDWIDYQCEACGKEAHQREGLNMAHQDCPKQKHPRGRQISAVLPRFVPVV